MVSSLLFGLFMALYPQVTTYFPWPWHFAIFSQQFRKKGSENVYFEYCDLFNPQVSLKSASGKYYNQGSLCVNPVFGKKKFCYDSSFLATCCMKFPGVTLCHEWSKDKKWAHCFYKLSLLQYI